MLYKRLFGIVLNEAVPSIPSRNVTELLIINTVSENNLDVTVQYNIQKTRTKRTESF